VKKQAKYSITKVKKYIAGLLRKKGWDNITTYLPGLTDADIKILNRTWDVKRSAFGYVEFHTKEEKTNER